MKIAETTQRPIRQTDYYRIFQTDGVYDWEGRGEFLENCCSDDCLESLEECQIDAVYWLHRIRGYDHSECIDFVICAGFKPDYAYQFEHTPLEM